MIEQKSRDKSNFLGAKEVAKAFECSESKAYSIIRELNDELKAKGYLVFAGKVSRKYFAERFYG